MRDYETWLTAYDDPDSALSWRLGVVRSRIDAALDAMAGPLHMVSACAGDGRDIIGALAGRTDSARVTATLLELHPGIAERARMAAVAAGLAGQVQVRAVDAGVSDAYVDLVPAQLVLFVGIFGNISDLDLRRTIAAAPQLCTQGAWLVWTRGRGEGLTDRNDVVRAEFCDAGFTELDYVTDERGSRPAVGTVRHDGAPQPTKPGQRWFSFVR